MPSPACLSGSICAQFASVAVEMDSFGTRFGTAFAENTPSSFLRVLTTRLVVEIARRRGVVRVAHIGLHSVPLQRPNRHRPEVVAQIVENGFCASRHP